MDSLKSGLSSVSTEKLGHKFDKSFNKLGSMFKVHDKDHPSPAPPSSSSSSSSLSSTPAAAGGGGASHPPEHLDALLEQEHLAAQERESLMIQIDMLRQEHRRLTLELEQRDRTVSELRDALHVANSFSSPPPSLPSSTPASAAPPPSVNLFDFDEPPPPLPAAPPPPATAAAAAAPPPTSGGEGGGGEEMAGKVREMTLTIATLREEIDRLKKGIEEKEKEGRVKAAGIERDRQFAEDEKLKISKELENLKSEAEKGKGAAKVEIASLKQQLDEANTRVADLQMESELSREQQKMSSKALVDLQSKLTHEESDFKSAFITQKSELESQILALQSQISSEKSHFSTHQQQMQQQFAQDQSEMKRLNEEVKEMKNIESQLKKTCEEYAKTCMELEKKVGDLKREKEDLQQKVSELENLRDKLTERTEAAELNLKHARDELMEERTKRERVEKNLENEKLGNSELKAAVSRLEKDVETKEREKQEAIDAARIEMEDVKMIHAGAMSSVSQRYDAAVAARDEVLAKQDALKAEYEEQLAAAKLQVPTLEARIAEMESERRISERKTEETLRDLRKELKKESQRRNLLELGIARSKGAEVDPNLDEAAQREIESVPSLTSVVSERNSLAVKVGQLQDKCFHMEEQIHFLQENTRSMADDLARKKQLLQAFCIRDKRDAMSLLDDEDGVKQALERRVAEKESGKSPSAPKGLGGIAENIGGGIGALASLAKAGVKDVVSVGGGGGGGGSGGKHQPSTKVMADVAAKMSAMETVLEETVLNNVTLQNEVIAKTSEINALKEELEKLRKQ